jgi:hypothetical protein
VGCCRPTISTRASRYTTMAAATHQWLRWCEQGHGFGKQTRTLIWKTASVKSLSVQCQCHVTAFGHDMCHFG